MVAQPAPHGGVGASAVLAVRDHEQLVELEDLVRRNLDHAIEGDPQPGQRLDLERLQRCRHDEAHVGVEQDLRHRRQAPERVGDPVVVAERAIARQQEGTPAAQPFSSGRMQEEAPVSRGPEDAVASALRQRGEVMAARCPERRIGLVHHAVHIGGIGAVDGKEQLPHHPSPGNHAHRGGPRLDGHASRVLAPRVLHEVRETPRPALRVEKERVRCVGRIHLHDQLLSGAQRRDQLGQLRLTEPAERYLLAMIGEVGQHSRHQRADRRPVRDRAFGGEARFHGESRT